MEGTIEQIKHSTDSDGNHFFLELKLSDKEKYLVEKWIQELSEAGYTQDEMITVFREARRQYEDHKKRKTRAEG